MKNEKQDTGASADETAVVRLHLEGRLFSAVDEYLEYCHTEAETDGKARGKTRVRFPNIAGFCRFLGTGTSDMLGFKCEYPFEYDRLLAIFEDEALNSDVSPTLLSAYIKKRMLYAIEDAPKSVSGEVRYCFEHDIFADGE